MSKYKTLSAAERRAELDRLYSEYAKIQSLCLHLDLTRGKPCTQQLALSDQLWNGVSDGDFTLDGVDVRNYGFLGGLPATRKLFAQLMEVKPQQVFIGGNASLQLMSDVLTRAYISGLPNSPRPWGKEECVKFLCPCPGYDRHFKLSLSLGMELVPVPLLDDGPDMDIAERLAADPHVKGIWCVPKYSNPDGVIYSDHVLNRLANMHTAAADFLIMLDNAYCIHPLYEYTERISNVLQLCENAGYPNRVVMFMSTSKITHAGAGLAAFAANEPLLAYLTKLFGFSTISYNKVNELLHLRFLRDRQTVDALMCKHADILRPKFEAILRVLRRDLGDLGIARWTEPRGGYFIGLYAFPKSAARVHKLCAVAGLALTPAGAAFPYGNDPQDSHLRIAPSYASLTEIEQAAELLTVCVRIAALERIDSAKD